MCIETALHAGKLTSWCAICSGKIVCPHFFKNSANQKVTVNGDHFGDMITDFFNPQLNNHDVEELLFQQEGAQLVPQFCY